jgi:hypothetical protein
VAKSEKSPVKSPCKKGGGPGSCSKGQGGGCTGGHYGILDLHGPGCALQNQRTSGVGIVHKLNRIKSIIQSVELKISRST